MREIIRSSASAAALLLLTSAVHADDAWDELLPWQFTGNTARASVGSTSGTASEVIDARGMSRMAALLAGDFPTARPGLCIIIQ